METSLKTTLLFLFSHTIYFTYNVLNAKNGEALKFLGYQFQSYWTYALATLLVATPILTIANYTFASGFHIGHKSFEKIWTVIIFFVTTQIVSMTALSYFLLKELPSKGNLVGAALAFSGLFVAMVWK